MPAIAQNLNARIRMNADVKQIWIMALNRRKSGNPAYWLTIMIKEYLPSFTPPATRDELAIWFPFHGGNVLVGVSADGPALMLCRHPGEHGLETKREHYLGTYGGQHCYTAELTGPDGLPPNHALLGLRDLFGHVDDTLAGLSGRAFQILEWDRNHRYCGRCGGETIPRTTERARECPSCKRTSYPPVAPAIMILIINGRSLLLARKFGWGNTRYSALAGFVEPGETLETTVIRETREEVGVEIKNIRYFGSQPWPFPNNLMIAFTAEYAGGKITPDGVEIEEARFFDIEELPKLPPSISISRRMITAVAEELAQQYR
jgi:NAD+ diphosphatase